MKQTGWITFVTVLVLALSLTRHEGVDQRARNFVNTLETRNRALEVKSRAMDESRTQGLEKLSEALVLGRAPSSVGPAQ
jgi:hypothetical protein